MNPQPFSQPVQDSVPKVDDAVAVGEDLEFQRKWWRFESGAWMVFALLLVLAVAGVFGRGPAARASLHTANGAMKISYDRIQRTGTPSMLRIQLDQTTIERSQIHLFISESVARELGAQRVIPQPLSTAVGDGGYTYTFPANVMPAEIELALEPPGPGRFLFKVSTANGNTLEGHVVVLP